VKIQPPGTPHSSAPNPQESRVCRQKPGQITKKRKKVGPLTRQEHPVLAVRVRGRRPYDRSDRRPHFKIAVGWGPESPIAFQDMHPACHIRSPRKIFHLERAWPRQATGRISAIALFFDFFGPRVARRSGSRGLDVWLPQIETASAKGGADCRARRNLQRTAGPLDRGCMIRRACINTSPSRHTERWQANPAEKKDAS